MNEQPKKTQSRGIGNFKPTPKTNGGRNFLFSIAIDDYENFPKLHNCVKDAKDIADLLIYKYQFEKDDIYTLYNKEATTDKIFQKFEMLAGKIRPIDNLIIYFAGHGEFKKIFNEGYWIPVNAESNKTSHYIPNSEIKTMLTALDTKHTFLIADSCFSGSLFARGATRSIAERVERFPSRWGLTSGRSEIVADGKPGVNSPFASSILYLLKNNTKELGVQELCAHVIESVAATAIQTPIGEPLTIPGHKGGQFVFRLKKDENRDWANTLKANDLKAYEIFIALYPDGKNYEKAFEILTELKEESLWKEAKEANTVKAFIIYKNKYPNGKYVDQSIERIEDLEDNRDWKIACRQNRISGYMKYKRNYPNGDHIAEANEKINFLQKKKPIKQEDEEEISTMSPIKISESIPVKEETTIGISSNISKGKTSYEHAKADNKKTIPSKVMIWGIPLLVFGIFMLSRIFNSPPKPEISGATNPITITKQKEQPIENPKKEKENPELNPPILKEKGTTAPPIERTTKPTNKPRTEPKANNTITRSQPSNPPVEKEPIIKHTQPIIPFAITQLRNSMVRVSRGEFVMGKELLADAIIHTVAISQSFAIGKTEITQEQWQAVMGDNPSLNPCKKCPVENISFYEAMEFTEKLSKMTGKKFRLPTEAEWEYAALAGLKNDLAYLNAKDLNSLGYFKGNARNTKPVASKKANLLGLYDMLGNVSEWCLDWYGEDFYKDGQVNPINKKKGLAASKIIRGGSFRSAEKRCKVYTRGAFSPGGRKGTIGLRVVMIN